MNLCHTLPVADVLTELSSSPEGLSSAEAAARLQSHGPNRLEQKGGRGPWRMLWEQATQTMILILVVAAVVSALLGKGIETVAIAGIVVLFVVLGFFQEYRAERAIAELARMAAPVVRARRDHEVSEIPSYTLVPGDVVLLEAGNLVPADVRLLESANLRIQEAALTGESEPVDKHIQPLPSPGLPLGSLQSSRRVID
jgi:P-type Ca2+ transporter type 2C